jgi:hypothetical protein
VDERTRTARYSFLLPWRWGESTILGSSNIIEFVF